MAQKSFNYKINRSILESLENKSIDCKSIEQIQDEEEWMILQEVSSKHCKYRIRKWKPVKDGWFCQLSGEFCFKNNCKKRK